jgi:hypothetical protein
MTNILGVNAPNILIDQAYFSGDENNGTGLAGVIIDDSGVQTEYLINIETNNGVISVSETQDMGQFDAALNLLSSKSIAENDFKAACITEVQALC